MNVFQGLCKLTQRGVKSNMERYLRDNGYEVIEEDGYLYAKGTVPVLLLAHMDTVHHEQCKDIVEKDGKLSSPQGIGGDDRCGVYIIMKLIKEFKCSVLFCEDEEQGCIGADKFAQSQHIKELDVNYMIEFDRKGNKDAVFYKCDNPEFTKFVTKTTGFKEDRGSCSDISRVAPAAGIAAVNLSSGYYNAHTSSEYVVFEDMLNTIEAAKILIATETEQFEYIEKKYTYPSYYSRGSMATHRAPSYDYGYSASRGYYDDYPYGHTYSQMSFDDYKTPAESEPLDYDTDLDLCLEVVYLDLYGEEQVEVEYGNTKAELWAKFFLNNPEVSFSMITEYNFA